MSKPTKMLTHPDSGDTHNVIKWAFILEVTPRCINDRIKRGADWWMPRQNFKRRLLTQPITKETMTGGEWASKLFIAPDSLRQRVLRYETKKTLSVWWDPDLVPGPKPKPVLPNPDQIELFEDLDIHESHDLTDWQKILDSDQTQDIGGRMRSCTLCGYEVVHRIGELIEVDQELLTQCKG